MSHPSAKDDRAKSMPRKPSPLSANDKPQEAVERDGPSAEEKLIAQVAAEARKAAGVEGVPNKGNNQNLQQEEIVHEELASSDDDEAVANEDTAQTQIADLSDRLARALAEVENMRRRFQREKQDALRYGASQLAMDVFEVADNLQRARSFVSDEAMEKDANLKNLVLGISMTEKALAEAFQRNQIVAIVPKRGDPFSAEQQQAVSEIASDEVAEGAVVELLQCGYRMGERLLRPAQVITAKSKGKGDNDGNDKSDAKNSDEEDDSKATRTAQAESNEAVQEGFIET